MGIINIETSTLGALNATTPVVTIDTADDIAIQVAGTFVGTVTFQGSLDGTNWSVLAMHQSGQVSATTDVQNTTTIGLWTKKVGPIGYFRALMSLYTSGTATVIVTQARISK